MGFTIEVKTGDAGIITVRGCSDGTIEFCTWRDRKEKDKDTGEITYIPELYPYAFYASVEQAFNKIARMRIASANVASLVELVEAIRAIRKDIKQEMGVL